MARYDTDGTLEWVIGSYSDVSGWPAARGVDVNPTSGDIAVAGWARGPVTLGEGEAAVELPPRVGPETMPSWSAIAATGR